MNDYGPLNLDEHATFWARDDERMGDADKRSQFKVDDEDVVALARQATFLRDDVAGGFNDRTHYFFQITGSQAVVVAFYNIDSIHQSNMALSVRSVFRPFCSGETARYGAAIYRDGTGQWFYRTQDKKGNLGFLSQSPFRFGDEQNSAEFLRWPQGEFLALCAQQWNSPDSEMRRAYEFIQLSLDERDKQTLFCENGDASELHHLTHLLAVLLCSEVAKDIDQFDDEYENEIWLNLQSATLWEYTEDGVAARLNRIYQAWRSAILRVVQPRYIGQETPLYIQDWLDKGRGKLHADVSRPTHHEQLEAQLQLRDWARQNLSEAEQKELFTLSN